MPRQRRGEENERRDRLADEKRARRRRVELNNFRLVRVGPTCTRTEAYALEALVITRRLTRR
jgi:hypothetical protein